MAFPAYKHLSTAHTHLSVNHSGSEYTRIDGSTEQRVHVSHVWGINSIMRWAMIGAFHSVSLKHLGHYTGEATFPCNREADAYFDRVAQVVRNGERRLLSHAFLTAKPA